MTHVAVVFEVQTPIHAKQSTACRIRGPLSLGYIKVKHNGSYAVVGPDGTPNDVPEQCSLIIVPHGSIAEVWTRPIWDVGDILEFELYDVRDNLLAESSSIRVQP